jgi:hypothetical protein
MADEMTPADSSAEELVPTETIPCGTLPALKWRDLPEPISWKKMVGPSIMLAGLALGSGEFVLWPYITYKAGFLFFWACMLGVTTQYFLNMEIERYTLATGESAITGFCRINRNWAWVFLVLNILPWAFPGWATGAATLLSWAVFGAVEKTTAGGVTYEAQFVAPLGIAGLWLVGIALTAGPVVYNTVERIQTVLVGLIVVIVIVLGVVVIRGDAVMAMFDGILSVGQLPELSTDLTVVTLLAAVAFAGAGGTTNLGQSNFIKDKGYGMGQFIGRITSPLTGQEEATASTGFLFPDTPENRRRWSGWWRSANIEHTISFYLTCVICLCLMSLLTYSLFYDSTGAKLPGMDRYAKGLSFVWGQATVIGERATGGGLLKLGFLVMGIAVLLTTELGVLDATARISTDIVKINYLRDNDRWSLSKLYYLFLWGEILLGTVILLFVTKEPLVLLVTSAAMNGFVMFVYSFLLLYLNGWVLPSRLRMSWLRMLAIGWSVLFFGYFSYRVVEGALWPKLFG